MTRNYTGNPNEYFDLTQNIPEIEITPIEWRKRMKPGSYLDPGVQRNEIDFSGKGYDKAKKNWDLYQFEKKYFPEGQLKFIGYRNFTSDDLHSTARFFNNKAISNDKAYIDFGQDINIPRELREYRKNNPDADVGQLRKELRQVKQIGKNNWRTWKQTRRTAGSDWQSAQDKQFYNNLGLFTTGIVSLPAVGWGVGKIFTNPIINHPITQGVLTIDGIRNLFTGNGVQKTYNHFKNGEYGRGALSLTGDILDATPLFNLGKNAYRFSKIIRNPSIESRNTLDDTIDTAISYWKRQIDPNVNKTDYDITYNPSLIEHGVYGRYNQEGQWIEIGRINDRRSLIHEMRHQADPTIHHDDKGIVLGAPRVQVYRKHGNISLSPKEEKILKVYNQPDYTENVAINAEMRSVIDQMMQKEWQISPTREMLDDYITNLPSPMLSYVRAMTGYNSNSAILKSLIFPNQYKKALINVK